MDDTISSARVQEAFTSTEPEGFIAQAEREVAVYAERMNQLLQDQLPLDLLPRLGVWSKLRELYTLVRAQAGQDGRDWLTALSSTRSDVLRELLTLDQSSMTARTTHAACTRFLRQTAYLVPAESDAIDYQRRIVEALKIALSYGTEPDADHKAWVIDQMVRALVVGDQDYEQTIAEFAHPGAPWATGVKPPQDDDLPTGGS